ncbi:MAG: WD40 repeat domain-containing protein [Fimbriiglobus sp.]
MIQIKAAPRGGVKYIILTAENHLIAFHWNGYRIIDIGSKGVLKEMVGFVPSFVKYDHETSTGVYVSHSGVRTLAGSWRFHPNPDSNDFRITANQIPIVDFHPTKAMLSWMEYVAPSMHFLNVFDGSVAGPTMPLFPPNATGRNGRMFYDRDDTYVVYGVRETEELQIWNVNDYRLQASVKTPINTYEEMRFTSDLKYILTWSMFKMYLIDIQKGKIVRHYQACPKKVRDACFTPDDRRILQVSEDRIVRVFDVETAQVIKEYAWDIGKLQCVTVSPDGLLAATGSTRGKVMVWDLD